VAAELEQARKLEAVGQLAAGVAHEINTPTQFIGDNMRFIQECIGDLIGLADRLAELLEKLKRDGYDSEVIREHERAVQEADIQFVREEVPRAFAEGLEGVQRVSTIVRAMKEFSHPGNREMALIDLNAAIRTTATLSRNEWKYVSDLEMNLEENLPAVPCLAGEFNQVILNLIINARDAIAELVDAGRASRGKITITTRCVDDWVEVRVSDTGKGIPTAIRDRVFDPFFTTKEVGKGTGQGLAIARNVIVEMHKGAIAAESEEGQGTTIVVRLPRETELDESLPATG
jgi:signal transduction histidine kinase